MIRLAYLPRSSVVEEGWLATLGQQVEHGLVYVVEDQGQVGGRALRLPECPEQPAGHVATEQRSGLSDSGPPRGVYTVGIVGPVGSGKTALTLVLTQAIWPKVNLAVIANEIFKTSY